MDATRKLVAKGAVVLAMGFGALISPPKAEAAPFACTDYCVSGTVCDEEVMRILCNGMCPTWETAICYPPPNSCGGSEIKIYCIGAAS